MVLCVEDRRYLISCFSAVHILWVSFPQAFEGSERSSYHGYCNVPIHSFIKQDFYLPSETYAFVGINNGSDLLSVMYSCFMLIRCTFSLKLHYSVMVVEPPGY